MTAAALALLVLVSGAPPVPLPVGDVLATQCRTHAADPQNPWALAHGMALDGRAFRARDGRPAADVIVSDFGPHFAPFAPDGTPIEPHPFLQLKTLLLAGYPPSRAFRTPQGPVTVGALVDGLERDFHLDAALSPQGAWTLDALAHALPPQASFSNGAGERVRVAEVMDAALALLEREQAELLAGLQAGLPQVPKRKQGIYAHPCGGLHLFQAVATHARHPSVRAAWGARLATQVDVLFYRLASESRQYDAALTAVPPESRLPVLIQMLKFYGHWLETLGRYRDETGWRPSSAQLQTLRQALALLDGTVRRLEAAGAWKELPSLQRTHYQWSLDLIGDTCHAARGWSYWSSQQGG